jgi:HEPN domain-containing protein
MNKDIQDTVENWKALSEYDYDSAGIMLKNGKYLYVCFMCQQCIEKILKGIYVSKIQKTPPYTHNLQRLLSNLSDYVTLSEADQRILEMLSYYYMESRYAEQIREAAQIITEEKATNIYFSTKALFECLRNKI